MAFAFSLFILWRISDLIIAYIAKLFDRYDEHFHYKFFLYHHNPFIPKFLISFANYDGAHYLHIAHEGYGQYQQAFFPFFPVLIRLLAPLFGSGFFLAGFFIANVSFFFGLCFFKKYLETIGKTRTTIAWIIFYLLTFPTSFFFGAVYTEGLFFLLVAGSLYFAQKKRYWIMAVFCFLASLTRFMGVFLLIPLVATVILEQRNFKKKFLIPLLSPLVGLFCYMLYLYLTTHNPLYFYYALSGFHTGRSTHHIIFFPQVTYRYFSIFLTASHNFTYFVAVLEFVTFSLFFFVLLYDAWILWKNKTISSRTSLIGLNLFSFVNLMLPTFTGTLTSLPRYALFSLTFFLRIAEINNLFVRIALLILFIFIHVLLLTLFIQGYFIS